MLVFLLVAAFSRLALAQTPQNPRKLGCERMYGDYSNYDTYLERFMQPGDRVTINGTVNTPFTLVRFNLALTSGEIVIHYRNDGDKAQTWYNTYANGVWVQRNVFGPNPYYAGMHFQTTFTWTGTSFDITNNGVFVYSYTSLFPNAQNIGILQSAGSFVTHWMEFTYGACPKSTVAPLTTTRRPSNDEGGHGHGGHHHHGHGGYGGGSSSSSSSGSSSFEEECD